MKYNLDCVRDILFLLENAQTLSPELEICEVHLEEIASQLDDYKLNEIANTLIILDEAGFIIANTFYADNCINTILVSRITYDGYQFLESIRPETVWHKVKSIGDKIGSFSMDAVSQIAVSVITSLINAQLCL